jgi:hypothetical protein
MFVHRHSRRVPKCRSRFADQGFTKRRERRTHLMKKVSGVIAGVDPAIHLLPKVDGYAGQSPRMTTFRA